MLGDAVAEREQTVGKVDVFKENVAAELDVGEVPDALYTEGDETVGDLLCDAFGHRQHRDGGVIGGAVGVQLVHPANGDAVHRGADDGGGNVEGGVEEEAALVEVKVLQQRVTEVARADDDEAALVIHAEDVAMCRAMGAYGAAVVPEHARILTHCNAGALATGGYGTALGVIRAAHEQGKVAMVYADETRPLLQGARLTAYELVADHIPATLIADNMAAALMARGAIDLVVVGCDRMAANGDFANKIGTYSVAVNARYHGVPFYTALPSSTIDLSLSDGSQIPIEQRDKDEVRALGGVQTAPAGVEVYNPAFDVTPHTLLTGVITERGIVYPPFRENLAKRFG